MNGESADLMIGTLTTIIARRLNEASSLAKAADACAVAGNAEGAAQILLDIDQPIYDAQTLLNATSLINRLARDV